MQYRSGIKVVNNVGYPVRLVDDPQVVRTVTIYPIRTNTDFVFVGIGEGSVYAPDQRGDPLRMRTQVSPSVEDYATYQDVDLHEIFVDAAVATEGVRWSAQW